MVLQCASDTTQQHSRPCGYWFLNRTTGQSGPWGSRWCNCVNCVEVCGLSPNDQSFWQRIYECTGFWPEFLPQSSHLWILMDQWMFAAFSGMFYISSQRWRVNHNFHRYKSKIGLTPNSAVEKESADLMSEWDERHGFMSSLSSLGVRRFLWLQLATIVTWII